MDKYACANFSLKTIATFSSTLGDEADKYYQEELSKPGYVVNREFRGSNIIITSKVSIKYKPDFEKLKRDEKEEKLKIRRENEKYKLKMKYKKEEKENNI